uniref:Uncharacterized protein n=1 Tax=Polysiphonia elongata TaxID=159753 RepID=A0A1Z1MBD3_9FLOR|nr:hypothetical protein [Polysiphonia elongata]ARW63286.1 hypothetical protein [Polysiphonia elongata]
MILSNFILLLVYQKNQCTSFLLRQRNYVTHNLMLKNRSWNSNQILIAISSQYSQKPVELSNSNESYDKLMPRNLWQKLINNYFQETIFLSSSNKLTNNSISQLKSMGLSVYDSVQYRIFLNRFSRDLINGKININYKNHDDLLVRGFENKNNLYIQYTWQKLFNINHFNFIKFKSNLFNVFKQNLAIVSNNSLPLFILVNNSNEIIMSESVDELLKFSNSFDFYRILTRKLFSTYSNNHHTCLLFVNYNDALEYKNHIIHKNKNSTRSVEIKIVPSNMNLYSKLKQSYKEKIDFRLIPDLEEISVLVSKYAKYRNVSFHDKQKYGYSFFQGQPLYQIQCCNLKNNNQELLDFQDLYFFKKTKKYSNLNTYFFNYHTALKAWQQLVKENSDLKLPTKPQILVSNLESFIKDQKDTKFLKNLTFLPSLENYISIKTYVYPSSISQHKLQYWLSNQRMYIKTLCYRIFWSLTSRQPNSW